MDIAQEHIEREKGFDLAVQTIEVRRNGFLPGDYAVQHIDALLEVLRKNKSVILGKEPNDEFPVQTVSAPEIISEQKRRWETIPITPEMARAYVGWEPSAELKIPITIPNALGLIREAYFAGWRAAMEKMK